jgi:hypothetical protein
MGEFFHDFDLFLWLLNVERIDAYLLERISFALFVLDQIHISKTALSKRIHHLVVFVPWNRARCAKTATYHLKT